MSATRRSCCLLHLGSVTLVEGPRPTVTPTWWGSGMSGWEREQHLRKHSTTALLILQGQSVKRNHGQVFHRLDSYNRLLSYHVSH